MSGDSNRLKEQTDEQGMSSSVNLSEREIVNKGMLNQSMKRFKSAVVSSDQTLTEEQVKEVQERVRKIVKKWEVKKVSMKRNILLCGRGKIGRAEVVQVFQDPFYKEKKKLKFPFNVTYDVLMRNSRPEKSYYDLTMYTIPGSFKDRKEFSNEVKEVIAKEEIHKALYFCRYDEGKGIDKVDVAALCALGRIVPFSLVITNADLSQRSWGERIAEQFLKKVALENLVAKELMEVNFLGIVENPRAFEYPGDLLRAYLQVFGFRNSLLGFIFAASKEIIKKEVTKGTEVQKGKSDKLKTDVDQPSTFGSPLTGREREALDSLGLQTSKVLNSKDVVVDQQDKGKGQKKTNQKESQSGVELKPSTVSERGEAVRTKPRKGKKYRALHDFFSSEDELDLVFKKGDIIVFESRKNERWWSGYIVGTQKVGLFQSASVEEYSPKQKQEVNGSKEAVPTTTSEMKVLVEESQRTVQEVDSDGNPLLQKKKRYLANYDYTPEWDDELAFKKGDIIILESKDQETWWFGSVGVNGKKGLFPVTYVEEYNPEPELTESKKTSQVESAVGQDDKSVEKQTKESQVMPGIVRANTLLKNENAKMKHEIAKYETQIKGILGSMGEWEQKASKLEVHVNKKNLAIQSLHEEIEKKNSRITSLLKNVQELKTLKNGIGELESSFVKKELTNTDLEKQKTHSLAILEAGITKNRDLLEEKGEVIKVRDKTIKEQQQTIKDLQKTKMNESLILARVHKLLRAERGKTKKLVEQIQAKKEVIVNNGKTIAEQNKKIQILLHQKKKVETDFGKTIEDLREKNGVLTGENKNQAAMIVQQANSIEELVENGKIKDETNKLLNKENKSQKVEISKLKRSFSEKLVAFQQFEKVLSHFCRVGFHQGSFKGVKSIAGLNLDKELDGRTVTYRKDGSVEFEGICWKGHLMKRVEFNLKEHELKDLSSLRDQVEKDENFLGGGTFATVFKVKIGNDDAAFKSVELKYQKIPRFRKQFEKVVHTLFSLNHVNIIKPLKYSFQRGVQKYGYFMEIGLCSVEDLIVWGRLKKKPISFAGKLRVLLETAKGLRYLHHPLIGLMHRDLKWSNVIVAKSGVIKIVDFGEMKEFSGGTMGIGTLKTGSRWFIAPEVLCQFHSQNKNAKYNHKCDVFSFSVMMYCLYFDVISSAPTSGTPTLELGTLFYNNLATMTNNPKKTRPNLVKKKAKKGEEWIVDLMKECWHEYPYERPSFKTIVKTLEAKYVELFGNKIDQSGKEVLDDFKALKP